ncbi:type 1 fimbrial protein [Shewanella algae]|uniref:type 1 fimbrial protein n=1 Tax=Shewanella algae TaxID=38313 RepID=UPI001F28BB8C|nr:type 1 fimbrial protein [Shewanella algae]MCE9785675.1 type 1 fimbrial protein [Shewanella algae]
MLKPKLKILPISVFGIIITSISFVVPAKSEGVITFQGIVVEPSCELKVDTVQCPSLMNSNYIIQKVDFDFEQMNLQIGSRKELLGVTAKIDLIEVFRLDKRSFLVTASYF